MSLLKDTEMTGRHLLAFIPFNVKQHLPLNHSPGLFIYKFYLRQSTISEFYLKLLIFIRFAVVYNWISPQVFFI